MQIPVLIVALALFLGPLWTFNLFQITSSLEAYQISLDNEAIKLGRADIEIFNRLRKSNELVRKAEVGHHILHACARNPLTSAECFAEDQAAETAITGLHQSAFSVASKDWIANGMTPYLKVGSSGPVICALERLNEIPIIAKGCPICRMNAYWEVDHSRLPLLHHLKSCIPSFIPIEATVRLWGTSLKQGTWNYSLHPEQSNEGMI